jgi:hypothetical protein
MYVPTIEWSKKMEGTRKSPIYEFVRTYMMKESAIRWKLHDIQISGGDIEHVVDCARVVQTLTRREICILYVYTTQAYTHVAHFLRSKRTDFKRANVGHGELIGRAHAVFDRLSLKHIARRYVASINREAVVAIMKVAREKQKIAGSEDEYCKIARMCQHKIRTSLTPRFFTDARRHVLDSHEGIVLYYQITDMFPEYASLDDVCEGLQGFKASTWNSLMTKFVAEIDGIFLKFPATKEPMIVYRGIKGSPGTAVRDVLNHASYISTSLSPEVASTFVDERTRCCVCSINIPPGERVVPLLFITRYRAEVEILLQRLKSKLRPRRYLVQILKKKPTS